MKKALVLAVVLAGLAGCATFTESYRSGNRAEIGKQYDEAIRYYEQALIENPRESVYRLALLRVKTTAALLEVQRARVLAADGKKDEAAAAYKKALAYDPGDRIALAELRALTAPPAPELKTAEAAEAAYEPPVKLKVTEEKIQLKFTEASLKSIFQTLGKSAGINFLYDEQFRDAPLSVDLTDRTFEQAVAFLCLASKNFSRIVDERTVVIVPDQPMKRLQYELNAVRTFYLSNINAADVQNALAMMIRTQFKAPSLIVDKTLNSITIRDTPTIVALAEKLLRSWDKARPEVLVDLEIMEVSRIKLRNLGVDLSAKNLGLRFNDGSTTLGDSGTGWFKLKGLKLGDTANFEVALPLAYIQFLESDSDTKIIAQPRLRGLGGEEIKYFAGQKVPIPQATFSPIAAGGVSTQPIVNYNLQDIGIDVKLKPRVHAEKEVTLEVEIEVSSIAGTGIADIPIIATRKIKNQLRLKDGETNLLAGLLRDEERKSIKGIAGLKNLPILGSLFSNTDTTIEQTDVILVITPYIIRGLEIGPEDEKPLWIDVEGMSGGGEGDFTAEEEYVPEEDTTVPAEPEPAGQNYALLSPPSLDVPQGREFRLTIDLRTDNEIGTLSLTIGSDPRFVRLKDVIEGGLLSQAGARVPFMKNVDPGSGSATIGFSSPNLGRGIAGGGVLATLVFDAVAPGEAVVSITGISGAGPTGQPLTFDRGESRVYVR